MNKKIKFISSDVIKLFFIIVLFNASVDILIKIISSFEKEYYFSLISKYIDKDSINECVASVASAVHDLSSKPSNAEKYNELSNMKKYTLLLNLSLKAISFYIFAFFLNKYFTRARAYNSGPTV